MKKCSQSFKKHIKKILTFTLLTAVQSENKNLAIVLDILKNSKDSIKKSNRLYLFKKFGLHCSCE